MAIDPHTLRSFVAVADQLHFGRAAATLGISRQSLSNTVKQLEADLGVTLFDRVDNSTVLTEAGRLLLEKARPALAIEEVLEAQRAEQALRLRRFRIGFVSGVTLFKWTRAWNQRLPEIELELHHLQTANQVQALHHRSVDVSFVRMPIDRTDLSVIELYSEVAVVAVAKDHPISLFDQVTMADLADEDLLAEATVKDTIEQVAAGAGVVIVPQSVAREFSRRDVVHRPVTDAAETQIALAWLADETTELVEEFVGIVRGRTAGSSRSPSALPSVSKDKKNRGKKRGRR